MIRRLTSLLLVAACLPMVMAAGLIGNLHTSERPAESVRAEFAGSRMEVLLPRLVKPDLQGGLNGWENAWKSGRFTVTRFQAEKHAHALQGNGDWKEFLPRTLIPRKDTQVLAGYDGHFLYLRITASQNQMQELRKNKPTASHDGAVWNHENLDILLTANRNSDQYCQLLIDCEGNVYDALRKRSANQGNPSDWNPSFHKHILKDKAAWILTLALPVAEWGMPLEDGAFIDCNIGRVELFNQEFSTLSPVERAFSEAGRFCRFWLGRKRSLPQITAMTLNGLVSGNTTLEVTAENPGSSVFSGTLRAGKETFALRLAPGQKESRRFTVPVSAPGPITCGAELLGADGQRLDMADLHAEIRPDMGFSISSKEYISGGAPLHAKLAINAPLPPGSEIKVTCGGVSQTLKAASSMEFDVTPQGEGVQTLSAILLRPGGIAPVTVAHSISISGDPFDE